MTPLHLDILLWYHARANDYREGDFTASAVRTAIDQFRGDLGLLENDPTPRVRTYRLTPRAEAYIAHILAVPLPECCWRIPATQDQPA